MNKKAIWAIIGLMSAAVIGIVGLQLDLIRTAAKVNEERFEKNLFNALNAVAARLEDEERKENSRLINNGFFRSFLRRQLSEDQYYPLDLGLSDNLSDVCPMCLQERGTPHSKLLNAYNSNVSDRLIEERIKLSYLKDILKQELTNRGIDIDYNYGIYSTKVGGFVIINDHYVVEENQANIALPGYKNQSIANSKYHVTLFPSDMPSPGGLMIQFPNRNSFVWQSLLPNLLGSIVLAAIILFCFGYSVNVIFRQKKLSEMKTDFINNMTHEFKTPIATISLAADSISSPLLAGKPDKVQRFANIIKQENKRMNSQVEKVLQMAQIDKRDFSLKLTDVNLHDVIGRAVENMSLQVDRRDGKIWSELEAGKPIVEGDLTHISNIINNLLDNANKYSTEKPEISVYTKDVSNGVQIIIKDRGIGMTKEVRKHIFDKFYRVHTGDLHDVKGFGLGLSYVKAMMTAHKGHIDVKSELGKGSSFILMFPKKISNS